MRNATLTTFASFLMLVGVVGIFPTAAAQTAPELVSLDAALAQYLAEDCGSGEPDPRAVLTAVLRFGNDAVPSLLRVVAEGPETEIVEAAERDARGDFAASRKFLADGGLEGLEDGNVREMAQGMSEETYVAQRVRGLDAAYRQRALNALVELRSPSAIEQLAEIGQTTDDEALRAWIGEAVAKLRG